MSLIINMLKDLDKRQGSNKTLPPIATHTHNTNSRFAFAFNIKYMYLLFTIILVFASIFTVAKIAKIKTVSKIAAPAYYDTSTQTAPSESEPVLPTASINKIDVKSSENSTEISFTLNRTTQYDINTDATTGQIVVSFDNAKLSNDIPAFDNSVSQINGIKPGNTDSDFIINLKNQAVLESVELNESDNSSSLTLTINNPNANIDKVNLPNTIKKPALSSIIINEYKSALHTAETGKTEEAIATLSKLLEKFPDYNDVRASLAALLMENKKINQAEMLVNEGLIISPDYIPLIELKAHLLTANGKKKEALMLLQKEQPLITDYPEYHAFIAALYSQVNNYKLAAKIYQKLVSISPHQGSWWFGLGVSQDKMGDNKAAIYAYTKAATEGKLNDQALKFLQSRLQTLQGAAYATE